MAASDWHLTIILTSYWLLQVSDVPGVVKLLDYIETSSEYLIVMELLNCCDLFDLISKCVTLEEEVAKEIFIQVVNTVIGCQKKQVLMMMMMMIMMMTRWKRRIRRCR